MSKAFTKETDSAKGRISWISLLAKALLGKEEGDVDIVGEQGLHRLVNIGYRKPYGRFEHPLTFIKRRFLEWRQNNQDLVQAKRTAVRRSAPCTPSRAHRLHFGLGLTI